MKILFIGDIYGNPGRYLMQEHLPALKREFDIDLCIANCENLNHGSGIGQKSILQMKDAGVDVFTSGNHLWDNKQGLKFLASCPEILKPVNVQKAALGSAFYRYKLPDGSECGVVCIIGQTFMPAADFPIPVLEEILAKDLADVENIFVDFHAEATAEKRVLSLHFDGKLSCLVGTHTHVQTADEQIMPLGCGYITDVGMTGGHLSGIGVQKEIVIEKNISGMPQRYHPSWEGLQINALFVELDQGKTVKIERIKRGYEQATSSPAFAPIKG